MILLVTILAAAAATQTLSFEAEHKHLRGFCTGKLSFDDNGIAFESTKKKDHSWRLPYLDVQQVTLLDNGEFTLLTYKDRKWRLGADQEYRLRIRDAEFAAQVAPLLEQRLERRFVSGVASGNTNVLWEIPAKHLLRFSGTQGTLLVAGDRIIYRTEKPGDSRTWFFSDIDNISSSGPDQLTITTYERASSHYGDRKGFNFQLKQPLAEGRYNDLWRRLQRSKGLQILALEAEEKYARQ